MSIYAHVSKTPSRFPRPLPLHPPLSPTHLDFHSYTLLAHNVAAMGLEGKVSTHHGDFLQLLPELRQDVVFLDPPWVGGSVGCGCGCDDVM